MNNDISSRVWDEVTRSESIQALEHDTPNVFEMFKEVRDSYDVIDTRIRQVLAPMIAHRVYEPLDMQHIAFYIVAYYFKAL